MRVAIANFGRPIPSTVDFAAAWASHRHPPRRNGSSLFDEPADWGFHIYALGVHLMEIGLARDVEFWDYAEERRAEYHSNGVLRVLFHDPDDVAAYVDRFGPPDLFVNHGPMGQPILDLLEGKTFRVHVPALRTGRDREGNVGAECYLVDDEKQLDDRSMLYIPVVNTRHIRPSGGPTERDFIYLASYYEGKRHDLLLDAARRTGLSGHLHPVDGSRIDLAGTRITTSNWNEADVVDLLQTSRIAVYPGDFTSSPAAMWECVAAGLPIVVNERIKGGRHLVVSGVTGELASESEFADVMRHVVANRDSYAPRRHFEEHWDTRETLESYVRFFERMGWRAVAARE